MSQQQHPFIPKDLHLPGYVDILLSQAHIVGVYALASIIVICFVALISGRCSRISRADRILMCWWAFTGLTHMILEGYFVFTPDFYRRNPASYLDEVWKEYSKGDSRYVGRNSAIVTVEGITAVIEGPASLLIVYAIGAKRSYSYVLQLAVSLGQIYGDIVYFITAFLEGDKFSSGSHYYWCYYVLANGFWLVIPTIIVVRCWNKITSACSTKKHKRG